MDAAGGRLGAPLLNAFDTGIPSFASATVLNIRFGAGHHDGVGSYRHLAYSPSCKCFSYRGGSHRIP